MKRPDTRYRKRLARVAVALTVLALAWLVYSRSILFLPMPVRSRIPLDYQCPFPLEADVSLPDCAPAVLDGSPIGMPDEQWGEVRVEFAAGLRMSSKPTVPEPVSNGDDPARYRVVYHGGKITEIVERGGRRWPPPWRYWPTCFDGYYYRPWGFTDPLVEFQQRFPLADETGLWTADRLKLLAETGKDTARWLCSVTFFPKRRLVSRRTYAYDADGRLVEKHLHQLESEGGFGSSFGGGFAGGGIGSGGFGGGGFGGGGFGGGGFGGVTRDHTVTERYLYDDDGHEIGHLSYEDSKLTAAEISVVRGTWPSRDEFRYTRSTSYPLAMTWARFESLHDCSWSAEYGANGRLLPDDAGVAGVAYFKDGGPWAVATVHFATDGRIAADSSGEAVTRYYWNTPSTWHATAHYGTDGRLVRRRDAAWVVRYGKSGSIRSETSYNHMRVITSYHRD